MNAFWNVAGTVLNGFAALNESPNDYLMRLEYEAIRQVYGTGEILVEAPAYVCTSECDATYHRNRIALHAYWKDVSERLPGSIPSFELPVMHNPSCGIPTTDSCDK